MVSMESECHRDTDRENLEVRVLEILGIGIAGE